MCCLSLTLADTQNELPYLKTKNLSNIALKLYVLESNSTEYNF